MRGCLGICRYMGLVCCTLYVYVVSAAGSEGRFSVPAAECDTAMEIVSTDKFF